MKKGLIYLAVEVGVSFFLALGSVRGFNNDLFTIFGLFNLILGIIGLVVGVIASIVSEGEVSKGILISSAFLLLMGFLTCSVYPMKF